MKFKKIYIEITNVCNLNCSFCAKNQRPMEFISPERFAHILKEIKPYTRYIYLHVLGEPLLHPELEVLLALAKEQQLHVNITSNGIVLPQQLKALKGNIRQLNLSLHSLPNEQGCHQERYVEDCLRCGDVLAQAGTYVSYRFWNKKQGVLDQESERMLQQISAHYQIDGPLNEHMRLAEHRFLHFEEQFQWPDLNAPAASMFGTCYGMRNQCAILVDGSVVPCCLDSKGIMTFGNIHTQSFEELLEQDMVKDMIQGFQAGRCTQALCQHCGYRQRFIK